MIMTSDGQPFETAETAKAHEITLLPDLAEAIEEAGAEGIGNVALWIVEHADAIVAILKEKPSNRKPRKRRSDAGKPKTAKEARENAALQDMKQ